MRVRQYQVRQAKVNGTPVAGLLFLCLLEEPSTFGGEGILFRPRPALGITKCSQVALEVKPLPLLPIGFSVAEGGVT